MNNGQAALTAVIFFLITATAIGIAFVSFAFEETISARQQLRAKQSYFLAEAGVEDAAYRLMNGKQISTSEGITLNGEQVTTSITTGAGSREIVASGDVLGDIRKTKLRLVAAPGASFNYGVQVGDGGLRMANSSRVIGSIYSNGTILVTQSGSITGDAFAAGTSAIDGLSVGGNAQAYSIIDSDITGTASSTANIDDTDTGEHAYADTITGNSAITQDAYYQTSIDPSVTVGGMAFSGIPAPAVLPVLPMPITDAQIDEWKAAAEAGGVISSPCPYEPPDGTFLGPVKISCDMNITGTKIITITGPIWVEGDLSLANSAQMNLDSSYGSFSEALVVDNPADRLTSSTITINNSVQFNGSGSPGSYILLISQNNSAENSGSEVAIDTGQSAAAPIYYAPHGRIEINNNNSVNLKEVTGYQIYLAQSAEVTYESGLSSIYFSSGPGGGFSIESWREIE